ncbi:TPA: hypothetical protein ACH3X1_014541 [Trebouxia sp. C0004]
MGGVARQIRNADKILLWCVAFYLNRARVDGHDVDYVQANGRSNAVHTSSSAGIWDVNGQGFGDGRIITVPVKQLLPQQVIDDAPLITRWWWPRPLGHHRQQQRATEHQESSKPVAGPEGAALALAITAATDIQSAAMHDMLVHVSGNIGQCAEDAMLLQRARHADVLEWLWFLNSRRKPLSDWTRPIHVDLHQTGEVFVLEK